MVPVMLNGFLVSQLRCHAPPSPLRYRGGRRMASSSLSFAVGVSLVPKLMSGSPNAAANPAQCPNEHFKFAQGPSRRSRRDHPLGLLPVLGLPAVLVKATIP